MKFHIGILLSLGITILLSAASFLVKISQIPIRIWDEARNANNAVHMHEHGNWMVPHYEGSPDMWNTKPPLLIWLQTISIKIFGINEFAIRIPVALAAIATAILLWRFANKYFQNNWVGLFCAAVLVTSAGYVQNHSGRTGDYDVVLILFIVLYSTGYFYFTVNQNKQSFISFWIFLTLAVLTKGIVGLMFLPGLFIFTLLMKKFNSVLKNRITWYGVGGFCLFVGGYYLIRENLNSGYLSAVYNNELGGRYLATLEQHNHPFGFYFDRMRENSFRYWFWWILFSFIAGFVQKNDQVKKFSLFNFLMVIPFFLLVSAGGTKLEWYVLPVFPFLALQIGWFIYYGCQKLKAVLNQGMKRSVITICLIIAVFFYPFFYSQKEIHAFIEKPWDIEPHQVSYYLQEALKNNKNIDAYNIAYDGYNGQIRFYMKALESKGMKTNLQPNTDGFQPGEVVLINQESLKKSLYEKYGVKILEEKFGCTLYLVLSRYEQPHS